MKRSELTISNSLMFAEIMRNEEICKEVINRIIPERRVKEIQYADDNNDLFAYIHFADEKNLPKRCRYIHSAMDVSHLNRGNDVNRLKAGYVIFICCFDYFNKGRAKYFFQSYDIENDLGLGDERYTIILNTKNIDEYVPKELASLLEYFNSGNVETTDDFITSLDEVVSSVALSRVGDRIMTLQDLIDASERRAAVMMEKAEKIKVEGEKIKAEGEKAKAEGEAMIREAKEKLKAAEKRENGIVFDLYSERLIPAEKAAEKLGISIDEFIRLFEDNSDME